MLTLCFSTSPSWRADKGKGCAGQEFLPAACSLQIMPIQVTPNIAICILGTHKTVSSALSSMYREIPESKYFRYFRENAEILRRISHAFNSFSRWISVHHPYVSVYGFLCNFLSYLQISCPCGIPWECILWDRGILLPNITVIKTTHVPTGHPQFFCSCHLQQTCWVWNQLRSHTASCPWLTCVFLSDVIPTLDSVLTLMGLNGEGQCWGKCPTLAPNPFENGPHVSFILTWPLTFEHRTLDLGGGYISSVILMSGVTLQDLLTGY